MATKKKKARKKVVEVKEVVEAIEMLRGALNTVEKLYLDGRAATQQVPSTHMREIDRLIGDKIRIPPPITGERFCP